MELAELFAVCAAGSPPIQLDHVVELAAEPPRPLKHLHLVDVFVVAFSFVVDADERLVALRFLFLVAQLQP